MRIKLFIAAAVTLMLSASCTKVSLPVPKLFASVEEVQVKTYSNLPAFSLNWEFSGGNAEVGKVFIQFCNDKEFVTPYVASSSGNSYVVTFRDLQKMQATFGTTTDYTLYIRMLVEGEGVSSVYSNKLNISVDLP